MIQIEKLTRMLHVAEMDEAIRNLDDEENIYTWLVLGVPDHDGEVPMDDLEYFAEDDERYKELCDLYEDLWSREH